MCKLKKRITAVLCFTLSVVVLFSSCNGVERKGKVGNISSEIDLPSSSASLPSGEEDASNEEISSNISFDSFSTSTYQETGEKTVDDTPWISAPPAKKRTPITVSKVVEKNGRYYVEHNGHPYLQYGVQVVLSRSSLSDSQKEEFFQKAAEIGFKTIIVAIRWSELEPEENKYNLYALSCFLNWSEKYDLNLELLWFGSNVCGSTSNAPNYVLNNLSRFPMMGSRDFDYGSKELQEREKKALSVAMDYIYDNDKGRRVSAVQILNEPNFADAYNSQKTAFLNYLDMLGKTVKNSPYRVVTRVNLVINNGFLSFDFKMPEEVLELDGIDMVGPDVYVSDLGSLASYVERFTVRSMSKNVSHVAEGPGQMYNFIKQVLHTFSLNSGFKVYELKAYGNTDCEFGIFRTDPVEWIKRDGTKRTMFQWDRDVKVDENITDDIVIFNRMVNAVSEQIANCPTDNFKMIFRQSDALIGSQKIRFETAEKIMANRVGAIFLADDGYYYCFTPAENGCFIFNEKTVVGKASVGAFKGGVWKENSSVAITDGNRLNVKKGNVYRIPLANVQ